MIKDCQIDDQIDAKYSTLVGTGLMFHHHQFLIYFYYIKIRNLISMKF